jgi:hypothetical protein
MHEGAKKLKSSSLATFNKKYRDFVAGQATNNLEADDPTSINLEADTLPEMGLSIDSVDEEDALAGN